MKWVSYNGEASRYGTVGTYSSVGQRGQDSPPPPDWMGCIMRAVVFAISFCVAALVTAHVL